MGEPIDHLCTPAFGSLPGQDVPADRPAKQDQLATDGKGSPNLSVLNAALQVLEQFLIAERGLEGFFHERYKYKDATMLFACISFGPGFEYKQLGGFRDVRCR
jgi:hypothetical protein